MSDFNAPSLFQRILYRIGRFGYRVYFNLIWGLEISGSENVPKEGGVLLAGNHISLADPPLVSICVSRYLFFFAKEELFKIPVFGWLIRQVNAFPVKREENDVGAFRRAHQLLKNGQVVLLFPEGRRSKTGELGEAKAGVGMLAYKTNVPVVPICIANSDRLLSFKKLAVSIGQPLFPDPAQNNKASYQEFSNQVLDAIADLKSKMYNERL